MTARVIISQEQSHPSWLFVHVYHKPSMGTTNTLTYMYVKNKLFQKTALCCNTPFLGFLWRQLDK